MPTKRQLIYDTLMQISQAAPSDDIEISEKQVAFWLSYELNRLVTVELNEKTKRGEPFPAVYVKRSDLEVGEVGDDGRIYVELDEEPLALNKQAGILTVITDQEDEIKRSDLQSIQSLKHLRFAKPSFENPLYYHQYPNHLYIVGFGEVDLPFNEVAIFYVPRQDLLTMDDDEEVLVSPIILPDVISATVDRGMAELYGGQQDTANDGSDSKTNVYHRTIAKRQDGN